MHPPSQGETSLKSYFVFTILIGFEFVPLIASAEEVIQDGDRYEWLSGLEEIENIEEYQDLATSLESGIDLPINILTADLKELRNIPWIAPWVAREIYELRKKGELSSLDDLGKIEGLSPQVIQLIKPFVEFESPKREQSVLRFENRLRVLAQLPSNDVSDLGSYLRSELEIRSIRSGFTIEKDRGEARLNDFQSGFVEIKRSGLRVLIGDYEIGFAQGLMFGGSYRTSPELVNPNRLASGEFSLRPHTGVDENRYLRGIGILTSGSKLKAIAAFSSMRVDARLDESGRIESLVYSGYHIRNRELRARKSVRTNLGAFALNFGGSRFRFGSALCYLRFDHDYAEPEKFGIEKNKAVFYGIDIGLDLDDFILFGEAAQSTRSKSAWILGLLAYGERSHMMLVARNYPETYLSPKGRPFSFYSDLSRGESGLSGLLRLSFPKFATLTIGNDLHKRGELNSKLESSGSQSFIGLRVDCHSIAVGFEGRLTRSETQLVSSQTRDQERLKTRFDLSYSKYRWLDLRLRFERVEAKTYTVDSPKVTLGELLRISTVSRLGNLNISGGFYVFSIEDYDSRIYQVEPGLPYYPTITLLNRDGARWYIGFRFNRSAGSSLSVKIATTQNQGYPSRREILCFYRIRM